MNRQKDKSVVKYNKVVKIITSTTRCAFMIKPHNIYLICSFIPHFRHIERAILRANC